MSKRNYYFFIVLITLMSSVSVFATDIYLPALPDMAVYFNCSQTEIQMSFTVFLVGLASAQLIVGILSDRFGRRKIVFGGFALFTIASVLCAYADTLSHFILFRILQAVGGGVGSVTSRALVADRYNREESVKVFSTIFPIIGLSGAMGPFVGGYLTYFWGWQSTFLFIAGFGLVILLCAVFNLKNKDSKRAVDIEQHSPKILGFQKVQGYLDVLFNLEFLGYAFIVCAGFCVFRSYSVESPFVFNGQGYSAEEMGHFYIALSLAYIVGNLSAKKLIAKMTVEKVLRIGFLLFVLGGACMVGGAAIFIGNPYALIIPMSVVTLGNGFLFPVASASAMTAVRSEFAGTASGLMGAIQCLTAAFCSHWIGKFCQGEAVFMSLFIGALVLLGLCSFLLLIVYKPRAQVTATEDV